MLKQKSYPTPVAKSTSLASNRQSEATIGMTYPGANQQTAVGFQTHKLAGGLTGY